MASVSLILVLRFFISTLIIFSYNSFYLLISQGREGTAFEVAGYGRVICPGCTLLRDVQGASCSSRKGNIPVGYWTDSEEEIGGQLNAEPG